MITDKITICKSGITVVVEDADGELYTIVAPHIADLIADWRGPCDYVPNNDALVHFVVYNGMEIQAGRSCSFEFLMNFLEINC